MSLVSLAKNPVPAGAIVGFLKGYDGLALRFARWEATRGPKRGTVCLFGGRGEFIEKYFELIADLRRRGFAVATMDWRGQGGSGRVVADTRRGYVASFSEYDRDLARFMREIVLPDCPPPFTAFAHSMGGNIILRNAAMTGTWFERLVLTAPMIEISDEVLGFPRKLVRCYAEAGSLLGFGRSYVYGGSDKTDTDRGFDDNPFTSDHERWLRTKAIYQVAPHLASGSATVGWLRAALRSCAKVGARGYPQRVQVPALMFAAGRDRIVSSDAVNDFGAGLKVGTVIPMPGAQHEISQESDPIRQRFWAAFDGYLGIDLRVI